MSTRLTVKGGRATMVYDDRWRALAEALGALAIERASEVEFDATSGEWVATHLATGTPIARGRSRAAVIAAEVEWLEANIL